MNKEVPESNMVEEYMPRKRLQRGSKFGLEVGKVFLDESELLPET